MTQNKMFLLGMEKQLVDSWPVTLSTDAGGIYKERWSQKSCGFETGVDIPSFSVAKSLVAINNTCHHRRVWLTPVAWIAGTFKHKTVASENPDTATWLY